MVVGLLWFSIGLCSSTSIRNDTNPISFELPYSIEKPEISKAIDTTLNGKPHIYKISSDKSIEFYVGLTGPKIDECKDFTGIFF